MQARLSDRLLTPLELVERWKGSITAITLATWRSRKQGPTYIKVGGRVLYPLDGIEKYERGRTFCG
jgi:hypothetical protein